jgi:hypothetical protein
MKTRGFRQDLARLFLFLEAQSGTRKNPKEKSGTNIVNLYNIKTYENKTFQSGTIHCVLLFKQKLGPKVSHFEI